MPVLTPTDLDAFHSEGYFRPAGQLLPAADFDRLRTIFGEHLAERGDALFAELDMPHLRDERLLDILLGAAILDLVEPITGPDIALWSSGFISKPAYTGPPTPWHEDSSYWEGRLDSYQGIVTIWLALDRSSRANGCLRVIPGSHLAGGFSSYQILDPDAFFAKEIAEVDEARAVYLELEPGECSLHDGRIMHGATANTSPHRRAGYTMRYLPASTRLDPERNAGHQVWLARGRAVAANTYVNA